MKKILFTILLAFAFVSATISAQQFFSPSGNSDEANALYQKAIEAAFNAEHDKAVALFDKVMQKNPKCFMAMAHKALLAYHWEKKDDFNKNAAKALTMAAESGFEKSVASLLKARLENRSEDASTIAKEMSASNVNLAEAHLINSLIQFEEKDFAVALEALYNVKRLAPDFAPAYNMLGYAHMEQQQMEQAEKMFAKYMSLNPDSANPYDSMGDFLMAKGDYTKAAEMFEKAYSMNKDFKFSKEKAEEARKKADQ